MGKYEGARDVPGYGGKYTIDAYGKVARTRGKGKRTVTPFWRDGYPLVRLTDDTGKRHEHKLARLVALVWLPAPPSKSWSVKHLNGLKTDYFAGNLQWIGKRELGKLTGANSRRQPVAQLDENGEVVRMYRSAREAGRQRFMSYQTIMDHCNGNVKRKCAPDGYVYQWADKLKA